MDSGILSQLPEVLRQHLRSLRELSEATGDPSETRRYALSVDGYSANLLAVDFDAVRHVWFPDNPCANTPCSVDAMYVAADRTYLIEFKTGQPKNLLRKVYDSALMLIEKQSISVQQLRQRYVYVVVSSNISVEKRVLARAYAFTSQPWETTIFDHYRRQWQLNNLDGVVVAKVLVMPPEMFDTFAQTYGWL